MSLTHLTPEARTTDWIIRECIVVDCIALQWKRPYVGSVVDQAGLIRDQHDQSNHEFLVLVTMVAANAPSGMMSDAMEGSNFIEVKTVYSETMLFSYCCFLLLSTAKVIANQSHSKGPKLTAMAAEVNKPYSWFHKGC